MCRWEEDTGCPYPKRSSPTYLITTYRLPALCQVLGHRGQPGRHARYRHKENSALALLCADSGGTL